MIIDLDNLRARVIHASPEERDWLSAYLVFEDAKARYTSSAFWDGKIRLFDNVRSSFPAGLLGLIKRAAPRLNFAVQVRDLRTRVEPVAVDLGWLRDYQKDAVQAALGAGRGIISVPTGGGKTEIFSAITMCIPCPWIIFVHKKDLLVQAAERILLRTGEKPGMIGDGIWDPQRVTVATFQTCHARMDDPAMQLLLAQAGGLVTDEGHVAASDSFNAVLRRMAGAYWRFGVSATPLARGDRKGILLVAQTGDVIYKLSAATLVEAGVLSRPKIRMIPVVQPFKEWDWRKVYADGIVRSEKRNEAVVLTALAAEKPCLLFVKEIAHGKELLSRLRALGARVEFVHGIHQTGSRRGSTKRLVRGDTDILIASSIFQEGVDIPELRSLVIATGGKSTIETLQRLGRGMRKAEGKTEVELWDFDDRGNPTLSKHSDQRIAAFRAEGYEILPVGLAEVRLRAATTLSSLGPPGGPGVTLSGVTFADGQIELPALQGGPQRSDPK